MVAVQVVENGGGNSRFMVLDTVLSKKYTQRPIITICYMHSSFISTAVDAKNWLLACKYRLLFITWPGAVVQQKFSIGYQPRLLLLTKSETTSSQLQNIKDTLKKAPNADRTHPIIIIPLICAMPFATLFYSWIKEVGLKKLHPLNTYDMLV